MFHPPVDKEFKDNVSFIVEVKAGLLLASNTTETAWFGNDMPDTSKFTLIFGSHIPQLLEQAQLAQSTLGTAPVYVILIFDVWFNYYVFTRDILRMPPSEGVKRVKTDEKLRGFLHPQPIFNNDWSAFTPAFLLALETCSRGEGSPFKIIPHAFFRPPSQYVPTPPPSKASESLSCLFAEFTDIVYRIRFGGK